jgi:hypothetical protein
VTTGWEKISALVLNYHVIIAQPKARKKKRIYIRDRVGVNTHLMYTLGFGIAGINITPTHTPADRTT